MAVNIEEVSRSAMEEAFARALTQLVHDQAEIAFQKAFANGSPLAKQLQEKIQAGFERFFKEDVEWEKKKAGFKE